MSKPKVIPGAAVAGVLKRQADDAKLDFICGLRFSELASVAELCQEILAKKPKDDNPTVGQKVRPATVRRMWDKIQSKGTE